LKMMYQNYATFAAALLVAVNNKLAHAKLDFDIFGEPEIFDPTDSIAVDHKTCQYEAVVTFDFVNADLPYISNPATDCTLESTACNGNSCLFEIRNAYKFSRKFRKHTGFDHVGIDLSPCGHPPLENFGIPHLNLHAFRVSTKDRQEVNCDVMADPFSCSYTVPQQTPEGRRFFVHAVDADGNLANVPSNFKLKLDAAIPSEGLHVFDKDGAPNAEDWKEPILIMGSYHGTIQFWEPMFPLSFVMGDEAKMVEFNETYVSQTIKSLPSYWSMAYNPSDGITTLIMKGEAESCRKKNKKRKNKI